MKKKDYHLSRRPFEPSQLGDTPIIEDYDYHQTQPIGSGCGSGSREEFFPDGTQPGYEDIIAHDHPAGTPFKMQEVILGRGGSHGAPEPV